MNNKDYVYLIIQQYSEDYHGTYDSVMFTYGNKADAIDKIRELESENTNYNIEYSLEQFEIL